MNFDLCTGYFYCEIHVQNEKFVGDHGYSNNISSMHPIFIARGASFKRYFSTDSLVKNVDLFPLMAHLLKLPPPLSDGDLSRVLPLLSSSENNDNENVICTFYSI